MEKIPTPEEFISLKEGLVEEEVNNYIKSYCKKMMEAKEQDGALLFTSDKEEPKEHIKEILSQAFLNSNWNIQWLDHLGLAGRSQIKLVPHKKVVKVQTAAGSVTVEKSR